MMMEAAAAAAASDHGAHFCAPPVHTEGMRPRLSSATLITGSFGKRDTAGGGWARLGMCASRVLAHAK